jgi:nucleotide-binding universal stress UspA family protein
VTFADAQPGLGGGDFLPICNDDATREVPDEHVVPILTLSESVAVTSPVVPGQAFEDLNEDDAKRRADEGTEIARRAGFEAEPRAELSEPTWESIVDVADDLNAAAIVMGTRALAGARELFEGSVSHDVIRHAGRPVVVVPPART